VPLKFVGIETAAYNVAKTMVVVEMMKSKMDNSSVLEVWFSSVWCKRTASDFSHAVGECMELKRDLGDDDVRDVLKHWQCAGTISLKQSRELWQEGLGGDVGGWVLAFEREADVLDACHYLLTGEFLFSHQEAAVGNLTMFSVPSLCGNRAMNELVHFVLDIQSILKRRLLVPTEPFFDSMKFVLKEGVDRIARWVCVREIEFEFIHAHVSLQNRELVERLRRMKPYSCSWSNVLDYCRPRDFHVLAEQIGGKDCVHFGYSLNWVINVAGAFIIDFPLKARKSRIDAAKRAVLEIWNEFHVTVTKMFRIPPVDNITNLADYCLRIPLAETWMKFFFSQSPQKARLLAHDYPLFNPLTSSATQTNMIWTYDQTLAVKQTVPSL